MNVLKEYRQLMREREHVKKCMGKSVCRENSAVYSIFSQLLNGIDEAINNTLVYAEIEIDKEPDTLIKTIMRCRYIYGYTWTKTAQVCGAGYSCESIRKIWDRYKKRKYKDF